MAEKDKKSAASNPAMIGAEEIFAEEYEEDRKYMRIATVAAVILHIIFFLVTVPEGIAQSSEEKKQKVYVVQQVRFKPPPPKQQQEIPSRNPRRFRSPIRLRTNRSRFVCLRRSSPKSTSRTRTSSLEFQRDHGRRAGGSDPCRGRCQTTREAQRSVTSVHRDRTEGADPGCRHRRGHH